MEEKVFHKFKPRNRHLHIEICEEHQETEDIFEWEEDKVLIQRNENVLVRVLAVAPNCSTGITVGQYAVVESNMIRTLKVSGWTLNVILEGFVLGILEEE